MVRKRRGARSRRPLVDTRDVDAAVDGSIDVLVLLGADPRGDFPDSALALAALEACPIVIALGTHLDATAPYVDVVLPVPADGERSGTTTNLEGRVTPLAAKVNAPPASPAPHG